VVKDLIFVTNEWASVKFSTNYTLHITVLRYSRRWNL